MDHIVFITKSSLELKELLAGERSMIVRGSLGKRVPYGRVNAGDMLFFAIGNGRNIVRATAMVSDIIDTPKLTPEENTSIIASHRKKLKLSDEERKKLFGKKYLSLIEISGINPVVPFTVVAHGSGENDDWTVLKDIDEIIE
ncbi:MAG TPA: hypothetical protein VK436_05755 [Methanocella sp.]|nr:hypothetical protein [Methanocella sp.]